MKRLNIVQHQKYKLIFLVTLFSVIIYLPKITIIQISNSHAGIRLEDVLISIYAIYLIAQLIRGRFAPYKKILPILVIFSFCQLSFSISNVLGIIKGNVSILLSTLHLLRSCEYFLLIFAGIDLFSLTKKNPRFLLNFLKIAIVFHGCYAILEYLHLTPALETLINRPSNNRIFTTFSGPYELAGFLTIAIAPIIYELFAKKQVLNIFYLAIALTTILLSESRIAFLGVIVITALEWIIIHKLNQRQKEDSKQKYRIIYLLAVMIVIFPLAVNILPQRFKAVRINQYIQATTCAFTDTDFEYYKEHKTPEPNECAQRATPDKSFAFRITKWATLIKATFNQNPLFGLGMSISGEGMDGSFTKLLCETGIIGLTLWIYLLFTIFYITPKNSSSRSIIGLLLIGLCINAVFIDIFDASKVMMSFWLICGYYIVHLKQRKSNINVIHVVDGMNHGGVESVLHNYYSHSQNNNSRLFIISHGAVNPEELERFSRLGFTVWQVSPKRTNIVKNFYQINRLIRKTQPDIVHVHMAISSYIPLLASYLNDVPVRIYHSHVANNTISRKNKMLRAVNNVLCTHRIACSNKAAEYAFGKYAPSSKILYNAIDINHFAFNLVARKRIRKKLRIDDATVLIGNVGRFVPEKNHLLMIKILQNLNRKKYKLLLIGDGELFTKIQQEIKRLHLSRNVIFEQCTNDISSYYSAMDIFLFPSVNEGFGIALIEAQASGLQCFASNAIPKETIINNCNVINLDCTAKEWADIIESIYHPRHSRVNISFKKFEQYDITKIANTLDNIYKDTLAET